MSGIDLWRMEGFGFWDIVGAAGLDIVAALMALGWFLFFGSMAFQSLWIDRECDWREKGKVILFALGLLFPLLRLIYLVCQIWIWD